MRKCAICKIKKTSTPTQSYCKKCRKARDRQIVEKKRLESGQSLIKGRPYHVLTEDQIQKRSLDKKQKAAVYREKYYKSHKKEMIEYQKAYRAKNREELLLYKREYQNQFKEKVRKEGIESYGGKCTCCGESIPQFLTIEHINGRSKEAKRLTGIKMWRKLQLLGWPKDEYTLLCFNCNCAKGAYGKCPHQK